MRRQDHVARSVEAHALVLETQPLLDEVRRQPAGAVDDAMRGEARIATGRESPADLPCAARPIEQRRDVAVGEHATAWDGAHDRVDALRETHPPRVDAP